MTGQFVQAGQRQVEVFMAAPAIAVLPDLCGRGAILLQQEVHHAAFLQQAFQRHRPAPAPGTVFVGALLARRNRKVAVLAGVKIPHEAALVTRRGFCGRRLLPVPGLIREPLDFLEGILPLRRRPDQGYQACRAHAGVHFGGQCGRFFSLPAGLALPDDLQTFRLNPLEPMRLGAVPGPAEGPSVEQFRFARPVVQESLQE